MAGTRRENDYLQKEYAIPFRHPQVTATSTFHIFKARADCRIDRIEYRNPTGLVGDAANAFTGAAKNSNGGATLASLFNTETDNGGATLTPNAQIVATPGGAPDLTNRNLAAGHSLDLVLTEVGVATLPEGDGVVWVTEI